MSDGLAGAFREIRDQAKAGNDQCIVLDQPAGGAPMSTQLTQVTPDGKKAQIYHPLGVDMTPMGEAVMDMARQRIGAEKGPATVTTCGTGIFTPRLHQ